MRRNRFRRARRRSQHGRHRSFRKSLGRKVNSARRAFRRATLPLRMLGYGARCIHAAWRAKSGPVR